jgi:penicillin-binding protein 2
MKRIGFVLLILAALAASCGKSANSGQTPTPGITPPSSLTLPNPEVQETSTPDAIDAASAFLQAWQNSDYDSMYAGLNGPSRDAHAQDDFAQLYQDAGYNLTLNSFDFSILSSLTYPTSAKIAYHVIYHTNLFHDIERDMEMDLTIENGVWKVQWDEGLILPELRGGNSLLLDVQFPSRGNIYDRNGQIIAGTTDAYALGIVPADIPAGHEGDVVYLLSQLTGLTASQIKSKYEDANPNWYVAIGEAPTQDVQNRYDSLSSLNVVMSEYSGRFYYEDGVAPQVIGYMLSITPEQMDTYRRMGYAGDEKIGAAGIEKWGEQYLAGSPSASLYVVAPDGRIVTRIVQKDPEPGQDIYTTLDKDLQIDAQRALLGFTGAIVVLDRNTGEVLAMVSAPSMDPNLFELSNRNSQEDLETMLNDGTNRLLNRATQSSYPLGSVFKIINMSAALESGLYTTSSTYDCQYTFTELPGYTGYDWTYEKRDQGVPPSGILTLPEGLMRSCNPWFYHLGLDLFRRMGASYLTNMAIGFGLGSATGIEQVAEVAGNIPVPQDENDAVQQGIGQGAMLVTPLQVADFVAAVGNGGTLYRPQVVSKIVTPNGTVTYQMKPEVRGTLPVKPETLKIVQNAMLSVTEDRRGTAFSVLYSLPIPIYGKTGTATNSTETSHAWFVGYTNSENTTKKADIAAVVFVEFGGEGSSTAAPIFRRVIENYYGYSMTLYKWETSFYVTKTPTPLVSNTPLPTWTNTPSP